ncbi:hypothetical protein [Spirosoma sp.]|uniref:hypothetical protein n=1 Tax=Spirosoma sp. TaxID=1899569 RepID=UPI003B3A5C69
MDDIFDFLNSTFEAGQPIFNGYGRIIGYANDGEAISGVFSLSGEEVNYQIKPSTSPGDNRKYTLILEQSGKTEKYEHLYAKEIIYRIKTGESILPIR